MTKNSKQATDLQRDEKRLRESDRDRETGRHTDRQWAGRRCHWDDKNSKRLQRRGKDFCFDTAFK